MTHRRRSGSELRGGRDSRDPLDPLWEDSDMCKVSAKACSGHGGGYGLEVPWISVLELQHRNKMNAKLCKTVKISVETYGHEMELKVFLPLTTAS